MMKSTELVGRVIGSRYRLLRLVGSGASAHVYVAEDIRLRRRVALKVLLPGLADDKSFLRRFQAEAQTVAALRHPSIVRVYDWGEEGDEAYLVMELLEGGSLRALMDTGARLTLSQAAAVGVDVASALAHAHSRGLVHRDIKPANLLFDEDGHVSVADFGIARALAEASWTEPLGAMLGTARYAAAEQLRGARLDGRADVYSLAMVLVEAVTGEVPFAGDTILGALMARADQPIPVPVEMGPLRPVLVACGTPEPDRRLTSEALAQAIARVATELRAPAPLALPGLAKPGAPEMMADRTEMGHRPTPPAGDGLSILVEDLPPLVIPPPVIADQPVGPDGLASPALDVASPGLGSDLSSEPLSVELDAPVLSPLEAPTAGATPHAGVAHSAAASDAGAATGRPVTEPTLGRQASSAGPGAESRRLSRRSRRRAERDKAQARATPQVAQVAHAAHAAHAAMPQAARTPAIAPAPVLVQARRGRRRGRRGHRWLVALVIIVVLCLLGGGGAAAYIELTKPPPTYPVPYLAGDTLPASQRALALHKWRLRVEARVWDAALPAGQIISQVPAAGAKIQPAQAVVVTVSKGPQPVQVPSLSTLDLAQATSVLRSSQLKVGKVATHTSMTVPQGVVISWSHEGKHLLPGSRVNLLVSAGKPMAVVASIGNATATYTLMAAALTNAGFRPTESTVWSNTVPSGYVISTYPAPGTSLVVGTTVTVTVSKGPHLVIIPSQIIGLDASDAAGVLERYGIYSNGVQGNPLAAVSGSIPAVGQPVHIGSSIILVTG